MALQNGGMHLHTELVWVKEGASGQILKVWLLRVESPKQLEPSRHLKGHT